MCWSAGATVAFVAVGGVATVASRLRGAPAPIWLALAYFTGMEALQVAGYAVVDACGTPENRAVTLLSYLHIVFQPFVINAFALELVPAPVRQRVRWWVMAACAVSAALMLAQLIPAEQLGRCVPGSPLCGDRLCTVSGTWHIAWQVPYNALQAPLDALFGTQSGFPSYMATVFVMPLLYGAWRFVFAHLLVGPVLAWNLTGDPNEMPAVWCLFSIVILGVGLSPWIRQRLSAPGWWGVKV